MTEVHRADAPPSRPWSCDTFVARPEVARDGAMLLGKNSDRPAGESQPLRFWPRRAADASARPRLAYVELPHDAGAWAHLGASPYWCWGHELGLNEWGVAIGNEALFTRDLADAVTSARRGGGGERPGLLGMELVRLGLERAKTAPEAVEIITDLVTEFGQWGSGVAGRSLAEGAYDNSYLVADPREAWVVETSGRRWAARQVSDGTYAISNQATIRTSWDRASPDLVEHAVRAGWWPAEADRSFDFARAYTDPRTPLQAAQIRLQRSRHLLAEASERGVGFDAAARVLRDHYEGTFLGGPYFTAGLPDFLTLCMHDSPANFTWGNTASSAIMLLPDTPDRLPHMWWAAVTPCTSVYLPVFPSAAQVPKSLALPAAPGRPPRPEQVGPDAFDPGSYWWQFQRLLEHIKGNDEAWTFDERQQRARQEFDPLEQRWRQELPAVEQQALELLHAGDARGREVLAEFTQRCAREALETCAKLTAEFVPIPTR